MIIQRIKDFVRLGNIGAERSPKWEEFKKEFEKTHPKVCSVCGRKNNNQLHHIQVFHLNPQLELDPNNVMWLCEGLGTGNHHIWWGHLGDFKSWNVNAVEDAKTWNLKIKNRPL